MSIEKFVERWKCGGQEKSDDQVFWLGLLRDVLGVNRPDEFIKFQMPVELQHKSFIDVYLPQTRVLIEQKSSDVDLSAKIKQSDGAELTPYEQAKRYADWLPMSQKPFWIVTCNFKEFRVYDMEKPRAKPEVILLKDLSRERHRLQFLIDEDYIRIQRELELSIQAGEIVGKIYDALLAQYLNPNSDETLQSLNKLCVRLVFCLYAESTGVFGKHKLFRDYLTEARNIRRDLLDLFTVLNTPIDLRDPYLDDTLKLFPYVNGGLFDDTIEIPNFTPTIRDLLLEQASSGFNWSDISPTIFGAVFESTLNPVTRRSGGMHYTSIENIHKVIDPLFLDDLREELGSCNTRAKLRAFQDKLSSLKFFDPACGSGNFLTETYLSLRRLENDVLRKLLGEQVRLGEFENPIKVSITQFYGIEINDFAVSVAKTALWISELQMMQETSEIIHRDLDFLPLKSYANIYEGNALRADWKVVAPNVNYIMGNPPFVGYSYQTKSQKLDLAEMFENHAIDYVAGWYFKAAEFMKDNAVRCAFVSTNSITQGEQVTNVWKPLHEKFGIHIDFAYRTFQWDSESTLKAHVHCIIIGNSVAPNPKPKLIFDGNTKIVARNINFYLQDADIIFIEKRKTPLCDVPPMINGSKLVDGGNLILTAEERARILIRYPSAEKFIKPLIGGEEFINNKIRYCLWLVDCSPNEIRNILPILQRVQAVREYRMNSKRAATRRCADKPTLFQEIRQPSSNYIAVPKISSERRQYIPLGFLPPEVIITDSLQTIPCAEIYHFGVLTSRVHMAWMRAVCGRLEMRYSYSGSVVYNNFVWCNPDAKQRRRIEESAQMILDVRAKYPDATLADLYDERTMPVELRHAHRDNDRAVMNAYGFNINMSEAEIVAALMKLYQSLTR